LLIGIDFVSSHKVILCSELLNVMQLYNLIPLLQFHYKTFKATTDQSAPENNIGILPLG